MNSLKPGFFRFTVSESPGSLIPAPDQSAASGSHLPKQTKGNVAPAAAVVVPHQPAKQPLVPEKKWRVHFVTFASPLERIAIMYR
ncbi:hypothetical protein LMH87_012325 [Akanthomyces muscarius]|uniref:Uncharacterized protein n=1 Tax=Akanthomyces muscarius TaxID=2231603 RepID=A0A9W8QCH4_AKAMU|nr:hypothetical protein LMH87_012325 [Akanthomyces muscarius]KAJ4151636.1 hypothetical protein LMH87_012325 [Akanthomyces muscarius]